LMLVPPQSILIPGSITTSGQERPQPIAHRVSPRRGQARWLAAPSVF
jgi:hypothetical protein